MRSSQLQDIQEWNVAYHFVVNRRMIHDVTVYISRAYLCNLWDNLCIMHDIIVNRCQTVIHTIERVLHLCELVFSRPMPAIAVKIVSQSGEGKGLCKSLLH